MMYHDRVLKERKELREKIIKLEYFIKSDSFKKLSIIQQQLLETQLPTMDLYLNILTCRLYEIAETK